MAAENDFLLIYAESDNGKRIDIIFEYEKGRDYSELRHALADLAVKSLDNAPTVNTDVLTNYDQMKDLCFIR